MSTSRLARNSLSSVLQVVVSTIIVFALYRFLAARLSISDIGVWSLVLATTASGRLGDMGVGAGVVRFVANDLAQGNRSSAASTVGTGLITVGVLVGALCLVLYPLLGTGLDHLIHDAEPLRRAHALLPIALFSLWLSMQGALTMSALDGCQRTDIRAGITIAGSCTQLFSAYLLVPALGLRGIAIAQLCQSVAVLALGLLALVQRLGEPLRSWVTGSRARLRQLLSYGAGIQAATLGQLLFDPVVKALLSVFGGLALTGYYELANRMVMQFRSLIVAGYQALVAYVASSDLTKQQAGGIYVRAHRLLLFMAAPYYTTIAMIMPMILYAWIGHLDSRFLFIAECSLLGWAANTLVAPAYFMYLALGKTRWPVLSQVVIGTLNALLGAACGMLFSGDGVIVGAMVALAAGSAVVVCAFVVEYGVPWRGLWPRENRKLVLVCVASLCATLVMARECALYGRDWRIYWGLVALLAIPVALATWSNEQRVSSMRLLRMALGRAGPGSV